MVMLGLTVDTTAQNFKKTTIKTKDGMTAGISRKRDRPKTRAHGPATSTDHRSSCCCSHQTQSYCRMRAFSSDPVVETYLNHSKKYYHNLLSQQSCVQFPMPIRDGPKLKVSTGPSNECRTLYARTKQNLLLASALSNQMS